MRVSRVQAEENRQKVIDVASRLFREHGFDGIGLKDLMAGAGLTQGAFYKQFASKEDLAAQASKRALERATAITNAELKRGISGLATIGSTAPFVGLFGTVFGIISAFQGMSSEKSTGLSAVAGGISEALITTAFGLFVAVPAVWMFNYFNSKIESFGVEMNNSSSELIDYFLKKRGKR